VGVGVGVGLGVGVGVGVGVTAGGIVRSRTLAITTTTNTTAIIVAMTFVLAMIHTNNRILYFVLATMFGSIASVKLILQSTPLTPQLAPDLRFITPIRKGSGYALQSTPLTI